jgi:uncharacterized protein with PQ loop repeat
MIHKEQGQKKLTLIQYHHLKGKIQKHMVVYSYFQVCTCNCLKVILLLWVLFYIIN